MAAIDGPTNDSGGKGGGGGEDFSSDLPYSDDGPASSSNMLVYLRDGSAQTIKRAATLR